MKDSTVILRLLLLVIIAVATMWCAIFNSINFFDHNWIYSENNAIKAAQLLAHGAWGFSVCTSPAWVLFSNIGVFKLLIGNRLKTIN